MNKVVNLLTILVFSIIALLVPSVAYAGNPPDQGKSTISSNATPADGSTAATVTITLKDSSGNNLTSNDSIRITSTEGSASFNPSSLTLDGSGTFTTQMKDTTVGNIPITVTDDSTSGTQVSWSVNFYQPGTASPTPTPTPDPNACKDAAPGSTVVIKSAVSAGAHSITLTWTDANNPVSYYLLSYGLSSGNYIYGNPNIGGQGTTSYTVGGLNTGTKYYFVIRAGNGCTPGSYSNEVNAVPGGSSSTITPTPTTVSSATTTSTNTTTSTGTSSDTSTSTDQITDTPTDTPIPMPTDTPTPTPAASGSTLVSKVVTVGTILGILIIFGVGAWIFINYRKSHNRPPPIYQ